jgi:hypothetical protein
MYLILYADIEDDIDEVFINIEAIIIIILYLKIGISVMEKLFFVGNTKQVDPTCTVSAVHKTINNYVRVYCVVRNNKTFNIILAYFTS